VPNDHRLADFLLDATEFSVADYQRLLGRLPSGVLAAHAHVNVTFDEARALAERAGKRLPTEIEYECGATFNGTRAFPWGNDAERIQSWPLNAVGAADFDRLPTDPPVRGLYSNVAEWVVSWVTAYPYFYEGDERVPRLMTECPHRLAQFREAEAGCQGVRGGPDAVVRGRPDDDPTNWRRGPRVRALYDKSRGLPGVGFRGARSAEPLYLGRE
jgi:formylglycine-generating enzyme required for sulfatase activity